MLGVAAKRKSPPHRTVPLKWATLGGYAGTSGAAYL